MNNRMKDGMNEGKRGASFPRELSGTLRWMNEWINEWINEWTI